MYLHDLPNECPPEDSIEPNWNVLYRLIKKGIIEDWDFVPVYANRPHLNTNGEIWCRWMWLSVFSSIDENVINKLKLPRFNNIACSELQCGSWKIKDTPSSMHNNHVTWRPYSSIDPKELFQIVDLNDE